MNLGQPGLCSEFLPGRKEGMGWVGMGHTGEDHRQAFFEYHLP